jgi:hypothetical protein
MADDRTVHYLSDQAEFEEAQAEAETWIEQHLAPFLATRPGKRAVRVIAIGAAIAARAAEFDQEFGWTVTHELLRGIVKAGDEAAEAAEDEPRDP